MLFRVIIPKLHSKACNYLYKRCMVLRQKANGNFNLTPTVYYLAGQVHAASEANYQIMHAWLITFRFVKLM